MNKNKKYSFYEYSLLHPVLFIICIITLIISILRNFILQEIPNAILYIIVYIFCLASIPAWIYLLYNYYIYYTGQKEAVAMKRKRLENGFKNYSIK